MLTEVRDCDLLIVVTSSTLLKRKDIGVVEHHACADMYVRQML